MGVIIDSGSPSCSWTSSADWFDWFNSFDSLGDSTEVSASVSALDAISDNLVNLFGWNFATMPRFPNMGVTCSWIFWWINDFVIGICGDDDDDDGDVNEVDHGISFVDFEIEFDFEYVQS